MPPTILGLDIGGANLKAATVDKRAVSVSFALWKNKDGLPAALAELVAKFPDAEQFAVTMTGELCDCYQTKREGVGHILDSLGQAAEGRVIRVWGTDCQFRLPTDAAREYLTVAAANWHALSMFAGRYVDEPAGLVIDIGSTTTDIIPLQYGVPYTWGKTDFERMRFRELVYTGVDRTPVCSVPGLGLAAAELFATTLDAYLLLGRVVEQPDNCDTADGRPATKRYAHARLSRMLGGDPELTAPTYTRDYADSVFKCQRGHITSAIEDVLAAPSREERPRTAVLSGSGEFLAREALALVRGEPFRRLVSLTAELGPQLSACAPAYAVATLAAERPQ